MAAAGFASVQFPSLAPQNNMSAQAAAQAKAKAATDQAEQDTYQQQLQANQLKAQGYALDQSYMMQGTNAPRTVTDTSMTIGNGGGSSASRSSGVSGGFGGVPAPVSGRYMSLVNFKPPVEATSSDTMPREHMAPAAYGPVDASAFQNAEFGQKKAQAGAMGKSAVDSLVASLAGRGIANSGTLGRGIGDRLALAQQPLTDLNVAHLGQDYQNSQHERDLSENARQNEYSGNINQRGQDASLMMALNSLRAQLASTKYNGEITQRGQDLDQMYRML